MTDPPDPAVQRVLDQLLPALEPLSPEQRLDVLYAVSELWCPHCGYEHKRDPAKRDTCQCWNDE